MKRAAAIIISFILFLSGCNAVSKEPTPVISNISFTAVIEYQNKLLEYAVTISETDEYKLEVLKNGKPTGLTVIFKDEKIKFSHQDIEYESSVSELPDGLIIDIIYTAFNSLPKNTPTKSKDDVFYIKNITENYNYTIYFAETGLPIKMEEINNTITAIFKNMKIL